MHLFNSHQTCTISPCQKSTTDMQFLGCDSCQAPPAGRGWDRWRDISNGYISIPDTISLDAMSPMKSHVVQLNPAGHYCRHAVTLTPCVGITTESLFSHLPHPHTLTHAHIIHCPSLGISPLVKSLPPSLRPSSLVPDYLFPD